MKKIIAIVAVIAFASAFTACKKDYTCTCTYNCYGTSGSSSATAHMKKSDADTWCTAQAASTTGCTYSCSLN